jgi:hypothetical protein
MSAASGSSFEASAVHRHGVKKGLSSEVQDVESERSVARLPFGRIISEYDEDARELKKVAKHIT